MRGSVFVQSRLCLSAFGAALCLRATSLPQLPFGGRRASSPEPASTDTIVPARPPPGTELLRGIGTYHSAQYCHAAEDATRQRTLSATRRSCGTDYLACCPPYAELSHVWVFLKHNMDFAVELEHPPRGV